MNKTLPMGTKVRRLASTSDYTNGRLGEIVAIDEAAGRYRVHWTSEPRTVSERFPDGKLALNVRTWVKYQAVEAVQS